MDKDTSGLFQIPLKSLGLLICAIYAVVACLAWKWEKRLVVFPHEGTILYAQESGEEDSSQSHVSQRIRKTAQGLSADYQFENFNQDEISIHFQCPRPIFKSYDAAYGYYPSDLNKLDAWYQSQRREMSATMSQSRLQSEYDHKIQSYFASKGFRVLPENVTEVDMPLVVRRNAPLLHSVAEIFEKIANSRGYGSMDIIGAVASLAQTAIIYRVPPDVERDGKHNGGFLPPVKTLLYGWGNCITKTGLVASILANWPDMKMVGISLPDHYLMGVLLVPDKGDIYVEYQGLQYVLVEPVGPGWFRPGSVGDETLVQLDATQGYEIQPFF